ncbi:MAG TPA: NAD(P)/FAD-dependent oxidoreductase [Desulfohalobiaceae bacterium]|nr:NAD(P)/FAD-dependent oxidoreductase [Desulfohalobiaceae bacterium]
MKKILILGCGFVGLNAAKELADKKGIEVTVIDRKNYHLFQPLLYQVATAGLSPADIATPVRSIFSNNRNIKTYKTEVKKIEIKENKVITTIGEFYFDYLILGLGVKHYYFNNEQWEKHAPGLKTIEQATEIRRRILESFERAEAEKDIDRKMKDLTFIVVGGGSTGVELSGAIGELSRFVFVKDFRNIDPKLARIILIEAGPRILPAFSERLSARATRDLEALGVQVWTSRKVTNVKEDVVEIGQERIQAGTVLWAAGIKACDLNQHLDSELDAMGRVIVQPDLSLKNYAHVFVAGDQAHFKDEKHGLLPANAPVALQQGKFVAQNILREINGQERKDFKYFNKGQMATIGRRKAVLEMGKLRLKGFSAWLAWLFVHIFYLIGFKNKAFVLFYWAYSYLTFRKGARLIVNKEWRFYNKTETDKTSTN